MRLDDPALGILAVVVLLGLAGCLSDEPEPSLERDIRIVDADTDETARAEDEYWMVTVQGEEVDEEENQPVCGRLPPNYDIHPANRSVVYNNSSYTFDPQQVTTLLAYDHEDKSASCPEAEHLVANPDADHVQAMGGYGNLTLTVHANGTVVVDGERVPLGQAAEVTYEGRPARGGHVEGSFRVVNLGAWDQANLTAGEP